MSERKSTGLAVVEDVDRYLALAGNDVKQIRALEVLAEAAKDFTTNHEQKKKAVVAKLKIARHGGGVLVKTAEDGTRKGGWGGDRRSSAKSELEDFGIDKKVSLRWRELAGITPASFEARLQKVRNEQPESDLTDASTRDAGSGDFEWFTPPAYIEAARRVMGAIDLDPASTSDANEVVQAAAFYTKEDNGLSREWAGRVWMNPPYAARLVWPFCEKLAESYADEQVTQACVLLNNTTETAWFQRLAEVATAVCFPAKRVKFWHPDKQEAESPKQGQAVFYLGDNVKAFCTEFKDFGFTAVIL